MAANTLSVLMFLRAVDYDFPVWAEEYMGAVEQALGDAYSGPAADVRAFVEGAKARAR
jgi:glutathione S-transferase